MTDLKTIFPAELADFLSIYGAPAEITPMHGLSHNRVWKVCFPEQCVVVKVNRQEEIFYRNIAPQLQGVPVPDLLASIRVQDVRWFVIEFIPAKLPRDRWLADREVLDILDNLHQTPPLMIESPLFQPRWDDAMTQAALELFPEAVRAKVVEPLTMLQNHAQPLFEPRGYISGDPNPANWGMRQNGSLVLYDWERFGKGTPALDLAITVPGLGDQKSFQAVADQYKGKASVRELALAKVWTVVEFMAHTQAGGVGNTSPLDALMQAIPSWFQQMRQLVGESKRPA